jgi:hypothetical protein
MTLTKRTYTLPPDTVRSFERAVPKGKRSLLLAELIRGWLQERERVRLRKEIVLGCREMESEYRDIESDFHALEEEADRGP